MVNISPLVLSTGISLLFTVYGIALIYKISTHPTEKNKSDELSLQISKGIITFNQRMLSAVIQIIIYVSALLYAMSYLLGKPFLWVQAGAFTLGSLTLALSTLMSTQYGPKLTPKILELSKTRIQKGLSALFSISNGIGFMISGSLLTGLLATMSLLGTESVLGYGLGVTLSAFFLRIGGGLFKASTDISADILPKIEKNHPESDSRSPSNILDIVGDYVGDIIGFSSDILGSFVVVIVAYIFFAQTAFKNGIIDASTSEKLIQLPLWIIGTSLIAALVSYGFSVFRIRKNAINNILLEGLYVSVVLCGISTYLIIKFLNINPEMVPNLFPSYLTGLLGAVLIGYTSERLTSNLFFSTKTVAAQAEYGGAISTLSGLSIGLKGNGIFAIYLSTIALVSYHFSGLYGISMAALGMLSSTSIIISINMFAPLASNIQKIHSMVYSHSTTKSNLRKIQLIGETTSAVGGGFATGASILASICLLLSLYNLLGQSVFSTPILIVGLIIGLILPYTISGILLSDLIKSVINSIAETRRQFKDIPYLTENKARPDVIKAADEQARVSMDSLFIPGLLMIGCPIMLGYTFGISMITGIAIGTFATCASQSFILVNTGESLHNAKYYIKNGRYGGKQGESYTHISIADNIGDSQKDLLNPMMNITMKSVMIVIILVVRQLLL